MPDIGAACFKVETQPARIALPSECSKPLPSRAPARLYWSAGRVTAYPGGEIVELVSLGETRREAYDATARIVWAAEQSLHQTLIANLAFARSYEMALIENDKPNIIDNGWIVAQRKVEFFWCRNHDVLRSQGVLIADRQTAGAIER